MSPKILLALVIISVIAIIFAAIHPYLLGIYFSLRHPDSSEKQDQALVVKLEKLRPSPTTTTLATISLPKQKHPEFYSYYYISGTTTQELRKNLSSAGPKDANGVAHDAMTYYNLTPSFKYKQENGSCSIGNFDVYLKLNILLPKWQNPQDAQSPDVTSRWDKFLDILENHESLHAEIAMDEKSKLDSALKNIPPSPQCLDVGNQFSALIAKYNKDLKEKENAYDQATIYGRTQGVIFP